MLIGARDPKQFLRAIGRHVNSSGKPAPELNPAEHAQALQTIAALVKKYPASLLTVLHPLVESVVRSLNPHVLFLRNACLKSATNLVNDLVRRYPMIAFNQTKQRLAVGTRDGLIHIYDLISATHWHTLEGHHKQEIAAVTWDNDGDKLASYSIQDAKVKIWEIKASVIFIGYKPVFKKAINVSAATKPITPDQLLEFNSVNNQFQFKWTGRSTLMLVRPWEEDSKLFPMQI